MKQFYGRPFDFSFKDMLAGAFSLVFFYVTWQTTHDVALIEVLQTLVTPIGIILGGYFVQETGTAVIQSWKEKGGDDKDEPI